MADANDTAIDPMVAIRDLIAERTEALQMAAAALQAVARLIPRGEQHIITFNGDWLHLAPRSIASILDAANASLAPSEEA